MFLHNLWSGPKMIYIWSLLKETFYYNHIGSPWTNIPVLIFCHFSLVIVEEEMQESFVWSGEVKISAKSRWDVWWGTAGTASSTYSSAFTCA
jgi:hypothetical protein